MNPAALPELKHQHFVPKELESPFFGRKGEKRLHTASPLWFARSHHKESSDASPAENARRNPCGGCGEIPVLVPCSCLGTEEERGGRKTTTTTPAKRAEGSEGRGATPKARPTTCLACVKTQHSPGETTPPRSCLRHRIHRVLRTNVQLWHALKSSTCYKKATAWQVSALEETCQSFFCAKEAQSEQGTSRRMRLNFRDPVTPES